MEVAIIDKAIAKITDEMMAIQSKEPMAVPIEEHLSSICTDEIIAAKILGPDKHLKGAIEALWSEAEKRKVGNSAVISSDEAFRIVDDYFELGEQESQQHIKAAAKIDVLDLL